ncbi:MAG: hypothetical protein WCH03_03080 [Flavobacteriia bacterium]|jgi:hypothetical protein
MEMLIEFLVATLVILIAIIAYRFLLRYLSKGGVDQALYCELYSLDIEPASGEVSFYFVCPKTIHVTFHIWKADEVVLQLTDKEYEQGGHLLKFQTSELPNGTYYFGIETSTQKTQKRFTIQN